MVGAGLDWLAIQFSTDLNHLSLISAHKCSYLSKESIVKSNLMQIQKSLGVIFCCQMKGASGVTNGRFCTASN